MKLVAIVCAGLSLLSCQEHQNLANWKPVTKLGPEVVSAARFLFEHGLADPQGGVYREATIEVSSIWGGKQMPLKVHAFQVGEGNLVVAWNGLTYKAKSLGERVDLEVDVKKTLSAPAQFMRGAQGNTEGANASSPNHVVGAFLLLRFGRSDLSEKVYNSLGSETVTGYSGQRDDPWFLPAMQYLSNRYDRGLSAMMRGDDKDAQEDFKELSGHHQAFVAEADKRLSSEFKHRLGEPGSSHPLAFVAPVDALYEDVTNRVAKPEPSLDLNALAARPQSERISRLIQALNQIKERQWGQPGGVSIGSSPIVAALIAEGDAAVEPLLDCMETDKRFTRSVSFGRDFFIGRNPITVASCARLALNSILGVNTSGNPGPYWSNEQVRKYWEANKGTTIQERWYRDLANDSAGREAWELAARNIIERTDVTRNGSWISMPKREPGRLLPPMKGESLRIGKSPTVTSLFHRRAIELMGSGDVRSTVDIWAGQSGAAVALASYTWDPKASLPTLQEVCQRAGRLMSAQNQGHPVAYLGSRLSAIYSARLALGDSKAFDEYRAFLEGLFPLENDDLAREVGILRVLWECSEHPGVRDLAHQAFNSSASPWNPSRAFERGRPHEAGHLVDQPTLLIPEYRAALAKALLDPTVFGEGKVEERNKQFTFHYRATGKNGGSGGYGIQGNVPKNRVGVTIPFRSSDYLLLSMKGLKGLPRFEIYWPDAERNRARKEIAGFLGGKANFSAMLNEHVWFRYRDR